MICWPIAIIHYQCHYDPLRDEGEGYGEKLRAAGVPVTITRYKPDDPWILLDE
jgi:acetyl esterase/lipase